MDAFREPDGSRLTARQVTGTLACGRVTGVKPVRAGKPRHRRPCRRPGPHHDGRGGTVVMACGPDAGPGGACGARAPCCASSAATRRNSPTAYRTISFSSIAAPRPARRRRGPRRARPGQEPGSWSTAVRSLFVLGRDGRREMRGEGAGQHRGWPGFAEPGQHPGGDTQREAEEHAGCRRRGAAASPPAARPALRAGRRCGPG